MSSERYVGERRALWHFLAELQPLVIEALGEDALLRHYIDRALKTDDLQLLRQARRIFHHHPDPLKRRLMRGLFEGTSAGSELPAALSDDELPPTSEGEATSPNPALVVMFDACPAAREEDISVAVGLSTGERGMAPVRIMINTNTLPRSAAETLRHIADRIEHDRRLLSGQHWTAEESRMGSGDETADKV